MPCDEPKLDSSGINSGSMKPGPKSKTSTATPTVAPVSPKSSPRPSSSMISSASSPISSSNNLSNSSSTQNEWPATGPALDSSCSSRPLSLASSASVLPSVSSALASVARQNMCLSWLPPNVSHIAQHKSGVSAAGDWLHMVYFITGPVGGARLAMNQPTRRRPDVQPKKSAHGGFSREKIG